MILIGISLIGVLRTFSYTCYSFGYSVLQSDCSSLLPILDKSGCHFLIELLEFAYVLDINFVSNM